MDDLTLTQRRKNMQRITAKDTLPEVRVRSWLFRHGFRFRKNDPRYPGKPDVVLPKYKIVIFVNGCFWHHHEGCRYAYIPKTRTDFWLAKFKRNRVNDVLQRESLEKLGWYVITIWECELKKDFAAVMKRVASIIRMHYRSHR